MPRDEERSRPRDRRDSEDRGSRGDRERGRDESPRRSSARGGGFEYQRRSAEDTRQRASKGANDFDRILQDGIKSWKPNDGDNRIRILPPTWKDAKHFGLDIYVHYGVGPDRQSYLCLNKMEQDEQCPICEEREVARRDEDEEYAKKLEAKRRVLVYIIDRDHEKEGVQAWAMPWTLDRDIVKVCQDKSSGEILEIDHPEEGYDVTFEKKGAKDRTEYLGVSIARRSSPLGRDEWLDYAVDNPLDKQLHYFDSAHIANVFNGGGAPRSKRDEPEDSREVPRSALREEAEPRRVRSEREEQLLGNKKMTWDSVQDMTWTELEDLIEDMRLDVNPSKAADVPELADWVCEELDLKKPRASSRRDEESSSESEMESRPSARRRVAVTRSDEDDIEEDGRLARMRRSRERS